MNPSLHHLRIAGQLDQRSNLQDQTWPEGRPRGRFTGAQRFDLAQWSKRSFVKGLVEIKNAPAMDSKRFAADAWRLAHALRRWGATRNGTVKWGIYLFSNRVGAASKLDNAAGWLKARHADRLAVVRKALKGFTVSAYHGIVDEGQAACALSWSSLLIH